MSFPLKKIFRSSTFLLPLLLAGCLGDQLTTDKTAADALKRAADVIGPKIVSVSPANGKRNDLTTVVVNFNEAVDASSISDASLVPTNGGACVAVVSAVSVSGKTATFTIDDVATTCENDDAFSFEIDPTTVKDLAGNKGTGSAAVASYTFDVAPIAFSAINPTDGSIFNAAPTGVVITMSDDIGGTVPAGAVHVEGACSANVDPVATYEASTVIGDEIHINPVMTDPCADGDTLEVWVDDSMITDVAGNAGIVGNAKIATYTIDLTAPVVSAVAPVGATAANDNFGAGTADITDNSPTDIKITLDDPIAPASVSVAHVVLSGTCVSNGNMGAAAASVAVNGGGDELTFTLAPLNGGCASGETLIVDFDPAAGTAADDTDDIKDPYGNLMTDTKSYTFTMTY